MSCQQKSETISVRPLAYFEFWLVYTVDCRLSLPISRPALCFLLETGTVLKQEPAVELSTHKVFMNSVSDSTRDWEQQPDYYSPYGSCACSDSSAAMTYLGYYHISLRI